MTEPGSSGAGSGDGPGSGPPGSGDQTESPKVEITWRGIVDVTDPAHSANRRRRREKDGSGPGAFRSLFDALGITRRRLDDGTLAPRPKLRLAVAAVVLGVWLVLTMGHITQAGSVTVPVTFGQAGEAFRPGVHFTLPWPLATTEDLSIQTVNYTMTSTGPDADSVDDPVAVLGSDGAGAMVDATVLYRVNPDQARHLFEDVGADYQSKLVRPSARACIRLAFTHYPMVEGATGDWGDVSAEINRCMHEKIDPSGLEVLDFQLREVVLGKELQGSVDERAAAEQKFKKQKFELETAKKQADITRVQAQATADAQQLLACGGTVKEIVQGDQKVATVVPNPTTDCQPAPLSAEELQYAYIQALKEIVGSDGSSTVILPGGGSSSPPIISLPSSAPATTAPATPAPATPAP